jgi:hypothetical protein
VFAAAVVVSAGIGGASAEPQSVGQVVALRGDAWAKRPGEEPRNLTCNEQIADGETVWTSEGARVGIRTFGVYTQLDVGSEVRFGITRGIEGEAPDLALSRGGVRVVDARSKLDAPRLHVEAPDIEFLARGADTEAVVSTRDGRPATRVCELDHFVQVGRTSDSPWVSPGECAEAGNGGVALSPGPQEPTIGVGGADPCDLDLLAAVSELFDPRDVAAPPGLVPFPDRPPADPNPRDPCDDPGSGCANLRELPPAPPTTPVFIDPGPGEGCGLGICDNERPPINEPPPIPSNEPPPPEFIDPGPGDLCALGAC